MAAATVEFPLTLVLFGGDLHRASRPEVHTPPTSLRHSDSPLRHFQFDEAKPWSGLALIRALSMLWSC
jgi:hypothetical protein